MKNFSKFLLAFLGVSCTLTIKAQLTEAALNSLSSNYQQEKIYIHYDKNYYVAGETIWFKGYLYTNGKPSGLSNNFYMQLLNAKGEVICRKKYPVTGATVKGDIELPDSLPQGYFTIRAFTPWMLNTSPDFLYVKRLFIFNPSLRNTDREMIPAKPELSVQFFPESGYLLDGILTTLAFKAVDSTGMPATVSGIIKMDDTINLAPLHTYHDGIGRVQIKPQYGKKYTVVITYRGKTHFFVLPDIQPAGINLHIEDEKGGKAFLLNRTKKGKDDFEKVRLVVQTGNRLVYESEINFEKYLLVKGHLVTDSLPSGILHFTVFSEAGIPLVERLTFVDNREYRSAAEINMEKKGLDPREENRIRVVFPSAIERSCSVSVTTMDENARKDDIVSSLLLTEDLKGYVFEPAWYFEKHSDSTIEALDNLMLTHGWSRFSWKKIIAGEFPPRMLDKDNYLISLNGHLKDSKTKSRVSGGHLSFFFQSEDSVNQNFDTMVDASGEFSIDSLLFRGKTKLFYGYTTAKGDEKPVDIYINKPSADSLVEVMPGYVLTGNDTSPGNFLISQGEITRRYLSGKSKLEEMKELNPVTVKTQSSKRPIEEVNEKYTKGVFTAMGRVNIDNINQPENDKSLSVYDFIRRSINNVTVEEDNFVNRKSFSLSSMMTPEQEKNKTKLIDSIRSGPYGASAGAEVDRIIAENAPGKKFIVALFLNEHPTYAGMFKNIRMTDVALIKYYEPGFIGVSSGDGPGGALAVYTKNLEIPAGQIDKLDHVDYDGYSLVREFYMPDYGIPQEEIKEDNRTTLYWNPDILMGPESGYVNLKFFNSDRGKRIRIVFEGFDAEGRLIHEEMTLGK